MTTAKLFTLAIGVIFLAISLHFVVSGMFLSPFGNWDRLHFKTIIVLCTAPSPDDRDFGDDVQEFGENVQTTITNEWNKIYGGQCQNDDQVREAGCEKQLTATAKLCSEIQAAHNLQ